MSQTELALIKKLYKKIEVLENKIDELTEQVRVYKITHYPDDTPHIYPSQPLQPIGPYFDNPTPKRTFPDYQGPWMQDKVYAGDKPQ